MYIITLNTSKKQIICSKQYSSILAALELQQITVEYQCRSGYCGSCKCRLINGQVNWLIEPIAYINQGEILLCCCLPISNIKLNI